MLFLYACGYILSLDLAGGTSRYVPSEESVAFAMLTHAQIRNLLAMFDRIITLAGLCAFLASQLNICSFAKHCLYFWGQAFSPEGPWI